MTKQLRNRQTSRFTPFVECLEDRRVLSLMGDVPALGVSAEVPPENLALAQVSESGSLLDSGVGPDVHVDSSLPAGATVNANVNLDTATSALLDTNVGMNVQVDSVAALDASVSGNVDLGASTSTLLDTSVGLDVQLDSVMPGGTSLNAVVDVGNSTAALLDASVSLGIQVDSPSPVNVGVSALVDLGDTLHSLSDAAVSLDIEVDSHLPVNTVVNALVDMGDSTVMLVLSNVDVDIQVKSAPPTDGAADGELPAGSETTLVINLIISRDSLPARVLSEIMELAGQVDLPVRPSATNVAAVEPSANVAVLPLLPEPNAEVPDSPKAVVTATYRSLERNTPDSGATLLAGQISEAEPAQEDDMLLADEVFPSIEIDYIEYIAPAELAADESALQDLLNTLSEQTAAFLNWFATLGPTPWILMGLATLATLSELARWHVQHVKQKRRFAVSWLPEGRMGARL